MQLRPPNSYLPADAPDPTKTSYLVKWESKRRIFRDILNEIEEEERLKLM